MTMRHPSSASSNGKACEPMGMSSATKWRRSRAAHQVAGPGAGEDDDAVVAGHAHFEVVDRLHQCGRYAVTCCVSLFVAVTTAHSRASCSGDDTRTRTKPPEGTRATTGSRLMAA